MPVDKQTMPNEKQQNNTAKILIVDSGVGGLSIFDAIKVRLPSCQLVFASDNEGYPYGPKSVEQLIPRVKIVLDRLIEETTPDLIVIACNTASTVALPHLRESIDIPIIGVVPAIKPAAALSQTKVIGLLATPGTIQRDYTQKLIDEHASDCNIIPVGSSELVELAEQKLRGEQINQSLLSEILQPFVIAAKQDPAMDKLVLACTHFPLLEKELMENLPNSIELIDSGDAISRRAEQLISEHKIPVLPDFHPKHMSIFTKQTPKIEQLNSTLARYGIQSTQIVKLT